RCVVAAVSASGIDIIGVGSAQSEGVVSASIAVVDAAASSVRHAIEEAANMAACNIRSVCVGITGPHLRSVSSSAIVKVANPDVGPRDIARVLKNAAAIEIPAERDVLEVIPQHYALDD